MLDVFVSGASGVNNTLWLGDGMGGFSRPQGLVLGVGPVAPVFHDVNRCVTAAVIAALLLRVCACTPVVAMTTARDVSPTSISEGLGSSESRCWLCDAWYGRAMVTVTWCH
jgi:hypothetical protein